MEGRRQSKTSRLAQQKIDSSSIRSSPRHTQRIQKTCPSPRVDDNWLGQIIFGIIWHANWCMMISDAVLFGFLSKKMDKFISTTWKLHRQCNIQPLRMIQRLTDGKTAQEPMEVVSLDGWANLYAPQTFFNF